MDSLLEKESKEYLNEVKTSNEAVSAYAKEIIAEIEGTDFSLAVNTEPKRDNWLIRFIKTIF